MRKVAIFVEGQGELIFIRNLFLYGGYIDISKISFECLELYAKEEKQVPYSYSNKYAEVHFQIINVGNDNRVLAAIKAKGNKLISKGYSKIIGLRDMYSEAYKKKSSSIDSILIQNFITSSNQVIAGMNHPEKISFHFAIMELETWWLGMYNLFLKINPILTVKFIQKYNGYNLSTIDPQKSFFHPAVELNKIFSLVGMEYKKSKDEVESITTKIESSDIEDAIRNNRCQSFSSFFMALRSY